MVSVHEMGAKIEISEERPDTWQRLGSGQVYGDHR
jgi:hypothetical protein